MKNTTPTVKESLTPQPATEESSAPQPAPGETPETGTPLYIEAEYIESGSFAGGEEACYEAGIKRGERVFVMKEEVFRTLERQRNQAREELAACKWRIAELENALEASQNARGQVGRLKVLIAEKNVALDAANADRVRLREALEDYQKAAFAIVDLVNEGNEVFDGPRGGKSKARYLWFKATNLAKDLAIKIRSDKQALSTPPPEMVSDEDLAELIKSFEVGSEQGGDNETLLELVFGWFVRNKVKPREVREREIPALFMELAKEIKQVCLSGKTLAELKGGEA